MGIWAGIILAELMLPAMRRQGSRWSNPDQTQRSNWECSNSRVCKSCILRDGVPFVADNFKGDVFAIRAESQCRDHWNL